MISKILKGKRKVKLHELSMESSFLQYRKNIFLRRYITIISAAILFMFWVNGGFQRTSHWTYFFALNNESQIVNVENQAVPQPFNEDDILSYSKNIAYDLFSLTPQTYNHKLRQFFSNDMLYKAYIDTTTVALEKSKMLPRLKAGWSFSVEKLGKATVKTGYVQIHHIRSFAWRVTYHDFVLYGLHSNQFSKIKGDLAITIVKTPFMKSPKQLSVTNVFISNMQDIGSEYGY